MDFLIPVVSIIAVFSWLAVASWSDARRKEREAFYKSETLKKVAEGQGPGATAALEYLREQEKNAAQRSAERLRLSELRRREGLKLGGLVNVAIGIALMIFLHELLRNHSQEIYLCGLIPLFIGVALLAYAYFLSPNAGADSDPDPKTGSQKMRSEGQA
jgi:hypothetical protein